MNNQNIKIIKFIAPVLLVFVLVLPIFWKSSNDNLLKLYHIGGIISGSLALIVTVIANYLQNKNGKIQRFENTFFNMLNLQQQITNNLFYDEEKIQGRELFSFFWNTLHLRSSTNTTLENIIVQNEHGLPEERDNPFLSCYGFKKLLETFSENEYDSHNIPSNFDHYFRHLYTIIKFVHNTDFLNPKEKYTYTSIIRATLSPYELIWLYYNCIYGAGKEKFKPLVEEYSLLKNIRRDLLALSKENKDIILPKSKEDLKNESFSGTDYEFHLSKKKNADKFYISAFYNSKHEISNEIKLVDKWNNFLNSK